MYGTVFRGAKDGWRGRVSERVHDATDNLRSQQERAARAAAKLHYVRTPYGRTRRADSDDEHDGQAEESEEDAEDEDDDSSDAIGAQRIKAASKASSRAVTLPIAVRLGDSPWSRKLPVDEGSVDGALTLVRSSGPTGRPAATGSAMAAGAGGSGSGMRPAETFEFGVHFDIAPVPFQRTKLISFAPRYLLVNRLPFPIRARQHHTNSSHSFPVEVDSRTPFYWADADEKKLCVPCSPRKLVFPILFSDSFIVPRDYDSLFLKRNERAMPYSAHPSCSAFRLRREHVLMPC
jgi:hypothetical protein